MNPRALPHDRSIFAIDAAALASVLLPDEVPVESCLTEDEPITRKRGIHRPAYLLQQLDSLNIPGTYYALDLNRAALEESMGYLAGKNQHVQYHGLWGTFEDDRQWLQSVTLFKCILPMGSMGGNANFEPRGGTHETVARRFGIQRA
ncbi:hypothetical protein FQN55_007170 [Onygenales sp. PD_40]|nr:hypothetical protein FQN55_007170 [Onygenales sp. PD_40]